MFSKIRIVVRRIERQGFQEFGLLTGQGQNWSVLVVSYPVKEAGVLGRRLR
jgi:hypothetical protein